MPDLRSAAFRTTPFTIEVKGVSLIFPSVPATAWLDVVSTDHYPTQTLGLMEWESHERFLDAIGSGRLDVSDLLRIAHKALAEAGGRPWWEVLRLTNSAFEQSGRLLGALLCSGVRPESMTLAAFCACVWATVTKGADATEMMKAESRLMVPPPNADLDEIPEDDDFQAMARRAQSMPGIRTG